MGSSDKPKCSIKVFKLYIIIREVVNLVVWIATMATMIPEILDEKFEHLMVGGAVGFGIFCAVIARCNRLLFTFGAVTTDGSI